MPVKDAFLAGVLAHVPEADRGKVETKLIELEEGGLRQADYSKVVAEARAEKERFEALYKANTEWFEEKKAALAERDTLAVKVAELEKKPAVTTEIPTDVVRTKALEETLTKLEQGAVGFFSELNALSLKHYQDFGEVLDTSKLLADKRVQQIGLRGVYADQFKDQIKAKADKAEADRVEAIRKDERTKVEQEFAARKSPYPVVGNEPSALDAIEAARGGKEPALKSVDDMAAEYARLAGTRTA